MSAPCRGERWALVMAGTCQLLCPRSCFSQRPCDSSAWRTCQRVSAVCQAPHIHLLSPRAARPHVQASQPRVGVGSAPCAGSLHPCPQGLSQQCLIRASWVTPSGSDTRGWHAGARCPQRRALDGLSPSLALLPADPRLSPRPGGVTATPALRTTQQSWRGGQEGWGEPPRGGGHRGRGRAARAFQKLPGS